MTTHLRVAVSILCTMVFATVLACAGAGRKWDTTHANEVQKGVQDKAQIQTWFGPPYTVTPLTEHSMGCTERWIYTYAWANWGGAQTTADAMIVDFDAAGVVCDHAYTRQ